MDTNATALVLNSGSSSARFALYTNQSPPRAVLSGRIERIGQPQAAFQWHDSVTQETASQTINAPNHTAAANLLMEWMERRPEMSAIAAVGHRVVHGGPNYDQPQRVTPQLLAELRRIGPYDPEHFPAQLELINLFQRRYPRLPQIACFDTAFHHSMPRVAKILPLPRRYDARGIRRYGFHGLSYTYLMQEVERLAGPPAARGLLILAHLGNGASMAAVKDGRSIDTTMAFTPTAGLPMSSRSGDLDPGVFIYLARNDGMTPDQFQQVVNYESGLLGVSETSSDMRDLLAREGSDVRAAEAVALFCYQAKKWIGALAAALGGLDTLVFTGGIGENAPVVRARICDGLGFLGVELDAARNLSNAPVISRSDGAGRAAVRVIRANEEVVMAEAVWRQLCKI
ncbi:MAG: acetate/propionate family kinase [Verrucomicrobiota bacterium]|jgi:acetate kinase